jgi:FlaA1/EpsC-like NDP-sugar epimerase
MTRFWISIGDASQFVASMAYQKDGGLKIPPMKAAPLHLVAQVVAGLMNIPSYDVKYIGMRPGEKIHECLRTDYEGESIYSHTAAQFTEQELADLLKPIVKGLL